MNDDKRPLFYVGIYFTLVVAAIVFFKEDEELRRGN